VKKPPPPPRRPTPARTPTPPPRLDRRTDRRAFDAPTPVEIFDAISGPFERHVDPAPRGAHRRR
jgi:hypothetical protein